MKKVKKEPIERVVIKIPKNLADFLRKSFPHGKRSDFVASCIRNYKNQREIEEMENKLRLAGKKRQNF